MSLLEFLKSKTFRYHLLLAIAVVIALLWVSLKSLDIYTRHAKTIEVPDLEGMQEAEAISVLKRYKLRHHVNDSIFDNKRPKGSIASQNPEPGLEVKRNRTIYLTTVAILPEMVQMPDLIDLSVRQAVAILQTYGLSAGQIIPVPDIARNSVLQQKYREGSIEPGTHIEKGTSIDLVIGTGKAATSVPVPLLIGRTREEAMQLIRASSLNVGEEIFPDDNRENLRVYRQTPNVVHHPVNLRLGGEINLQYRSADDFDFDDYLADALSVPNPDLTGKTPEEIEEIFSNSFLELGNIVYEFDVSPDRARVYRQQPDRLDRPSLPRGTQINIWYRDINDFDLD